MGLESANTSIMKGDFVRKKVHHDVSINLS